jgi:hypothetical protein
MSKIVSHTPVEVEAFAALMGSMGFSNLLREATPEPEKLASWWSYRIAASLPLKTLLTLLSILPVLCKIGHLANKSCVRQFECRGYCLYSVSSTHRGND